MTDPGLSEGPYFRELRGRCCSRMGASPTQCSPMRKPSTSPRSTVTAHFLAQVYIESNDPKVNKRAIAHLNDALRTETRKVTAGIYWRRLMGATIRWVWPFSARRGRTVRREEEGRDTAGQPRQGAVAEEPRSV